MVKGGPVMYLLLVCSFISLTLIIERFIFWMKEAKGRNIKLIDRVLHFIEKGHYRQALETSKDGRDYIVKIFHSGITHHHFSLEGALEMAAGNELKRMKKFLNVLDTIVTVAPLLGILGTVIGIIISFDLLGRAGIEDPRAVTGGIAQALITTAAGLSIAILTLIPYNYFLAKVEDATAEMERHLTNFEILYKKGQARDED